ncbi:hypothetical protein SLS62_010888 [Diatrype stigma]|uniref:Uncharacterized protein n=1 Tax=Diatrype stigma TaxID=117547 RepID=A0AAN9U7E3_9PEZI
MPYISYESFEHYRKYSRILSDAKGRHGSKMSFGDLRFNNFEYEGILSSRDNLRSKSSETTIEDETMILAYMDYKHDGQDLSLHPRETLDQSYYYMMKDTAYRDRTQVVSRWNHSSDGHMNWAKTWISKPKHNILMVDQLWMWKISKAGQIPHDTIITCFPMRHEASEAHVDEASLYGNMDDMREHILPESVEKRIRSVDDVIGRILAACTNIFEDTDVQSLQFRKFFEKAIGYMEEELLQRFRRFRHNAESLYSLVEEYNNYRKDRVEYLKELLDIRAESRLLEDVKDVLDEVKMIQEVFKNQDTIDFRIFGEPALLEFQSQLEAAKTMFKIIAERAKSVESGIMKLMDLKQKQANLWEARSSREGAEQTAKQGKLPLSFTASFFAISIDHFPRDEKSDDVKWPLRYLCALLFGVSAAVIAPLTLAAFNIQWLESRWKAARVALFTKPTLLMLRQLWRVVSLKLAMSEMAGYGRIQRSSWREEVSRYKNVLLVSLAEWHGKLLRGLIDYSTRTTPGNLKEHIRAATEPRILYNQELWGSDYYNAHWMVLMEISHFNMHKWLSIYGDEEEISQLNIHERRSIYGDEEEMKTARLQEQDSWKILHIIERFGFPVRY